MTELEQELHELLESADVVDGWFRVLREALRRYRRVYGTPPRSWRRTYIHCRGALELHRQRLKDLRILVAIERAEGLR
jgi:hypothetical protein